MKRILITTALLLIITSCNFKANQDKKIIEITCATLLYGSSEYLVIDPVNKTVIDNGEKTENVLIDRNRIYFTTSDKKFVAKIDRTTGKMIVTEPSNPSSRLEYNCELVKPKF